MLTGSTPLDADELKGIKINVHNRKELDEAESLNISRGLLWIKTNPTSNQNTLSLKYLCELHFKMFGDVWEWAGKFRTSDKNIGCPWMYISAELKNTFEDAKIWIENNVFTNEEIAVRLHHRLVQVHPFVNGNGRLTRIYATLISEKLGCSPLEWGGLALESTAQSENIRKEYLAALRKADQGDYSDLIAFGTSAGDIIEESSSLEP